MMTYGDDPIAKTPEPLGYTPVLEERFLRITTLHSEREQDEIK